MGVLLNGERLNNIRYADDTVMFADTPESLRFLVDRVTMSSNKYGLDINTNKTKFMVISKANVPNCNIESNGKPIERVSGYTCLGTNINDQWDHAQKIKIRIEKARAVFGNMSKIFKNHDLTLTTKVRFLLCYVFSVLLYGVESWTLTEATSKRLEAFEMWLYRRILRVSWTDRVKNETVSQRMNKQK